MDDSTADGIAALEGLADGVAERLLVAVEAARIGTWEWRPETGELFWCPRAAEIAGLPAGSGDAQELGLDDLLALALADDVEQVQRELERALRAAAASAGDARFRVRCRIRRPEGGQVRQLRLEGRVLAGEDGRADRVLGAVTDLTDDEAREHERQLLLEQAVAARDAAEAANGELESVLARMHDAVFGLDRDFRVTWANDACIDGLRLPRERLVGAVFWDLFPDGRDGLLHDELAEALATGEPRAFEAYYDRWDDTTLVRVYPTGDGLIVFSTNVTTTRRALRALQEREEQLRLALATARLVRWEWDVGARVVRRDQPGAALLAIAPVLTIDEFLERVHPDDRASWLASWDAAVATGDDLVVEFRIVGEDGVTRWVVSRGRVSRSDAQGRPLALSGISLDATPLWLAEEQLRIARHRLDALTSANVIGVAVGTRDRIDDANDLYLALLGRTRGELAAGALEVSGVTPPEYADVDGLRWQELIGTGMMSAFEKEYLRPDGTRVPVLVGAAVLDRDRGEWMAFALDLTERRRAEDRLAALQRLSAALARALTRRQIARATLEAGAAALGARAGTFTVLDPAREELELAQWFGYPPGAMERGTRAPLAQGTAEARACETRAPVFAGTPEEAVRSSPGYEQLVEQSGVAALAALPLMAGERVLGAVTFAWGEPRSFTAADRDYMASIAELSAQALLRGIRYEAEREIAVTLQRSIIPAELPTLEDVELDAAYLPAGESVEVGGDWYDVFPLGDDVLVLAIGDVAGKGVLAASAMAQFRNALRAYAVDGLGPSAVLERLNRLSELMPDAPFATVQIAYLSRATGIVRYASAGHPPAAVRTAAGMVGFVERGRGMPIGAGPGSLYDETAVQLNPGDMLVLYTDGLVERRTRSLDEGFARLARALALPDPPGGPPPPVVAHVLRQLVSSGRAQDDVAILSARYRPPAGPAAAP